MALFKKKKPTSSSDNTIEQIKKELTPDTSENVDYGLSDDVKDAIDDIIPAISNGDLNLIPAVYNAEVLTDSVSKASLNSIFTLINYSQEFLKKDPKGEKGFANIFMNILAGGIAVRIKSAETLYSVFSSELKTPYPLISFGYALLFFSEADAEIWAEKYKEKHESKVFVKTFSGDEIKGYFELLTALGIQSICVEPHISRMIIHQQPIFDTSFETVSHPSVQFFSIRFVQVLKSNILKKDVNTAHGAILSSIISSKFICPGKTVNGKFIVASLQQPESAMILAFTDKRELDIAAKDNEAIGKFLETAELKDLSFKELEKFLMAPNVDTLCINFAGTGFALRRNVYENLYKAIKENPDKKISINVE